MVTILIIVQVTLIEFDFLTAILKGNGRLHLKKLDVDQSH